MRFLILAVSLSPLAVAQLFDGGLTSSLRASPRQLEETPTGDAGDQTLEQLEDDSKNIMGHMVQSFLAKEKISEEDRKCLVNSSEVFTEQVSQLAGHIVMLTQELLGQRSGAHLPGLREFGLHNVTLDAGRDASARRTGEQSKEKEDHGAEKDHRTSDEMSYFYKQQRRLVEERDEQQPERSEHSGGMGLALLMNAADILKQTGDSIKLMAKLSTHVVQDCVKGRSAKVLDRASRHFKDLGFMSGHFMANGPKVIEGMARAVEEYKAHNYSGFGDEMGLSMREILLTKTDTRNLPHGQVGKAMMVNMSMGVVHGFFGKGFDADISLDKDPDEPIRINLEKCIAKNMPFFAQIYSTMAMAAAKNRAEREANPSSQFEAGRNDRQMAFGTEAAVAAMEIPDALHKCGLGTRQADMLLDAIKAFGAGMHLTLSTPNEKPTSRQITQNLGATINSWDHHEWREFGTDLGKLFQEMTLSFFPQKYSVDDTGALQQKFASLSDVPGGPRVDGSVLAKFLSLSALFGMVASAVVLRRGQHRQRRSNAERSLLVSESTSDEASLDSRQCDLERGNDDALE